MGANMKNEIAKVFSELQIEYFSAIGMENLKTVKPHLLERLGFVPESAIIFLVPYYSGDGENLSAYAVARDYHIFLKEAGEELCFLLKEKLGFDAACFADHSPIDERDAAAKCALGILGDNGLLINEKYGTYVFIGEVLTDAPPELLGAREPSVPEGCLHCGSCLSACPKREIGVCLSALTQKKGSLTEHERRSIKKHGSVWGCDLCQILCPYNKNPKTTPVKFFSEDRITYITREALAGMGKEEFASRAYSWRGEDTLLRNIEIFEENDA